MSTDAAAYDDLDIARAANNLLWWTGYWRRNEILVSVNQGWVTLSGVVDWDYQKRTAVHALQALTGIAGIVDHISIKFDAAAEAGGSQDEPGQTIDAVSFSRWS